jgi:hypothetical protein
LQGLAIKTLTELKSANESTSGKTGFTHAANNLLNAVIKVLLLADIVSINHIVNAKLKVSEIGQFQK